MRLRILRLLPVVLCLGCTLLPPPPPQEPLAASQTNKENKPESLLQQAAKHLDEGRDDEALPCLAQYVAVRPEHAVIRAHFAELLLKLNKPEEARTQFEQYIVDAQIQGEPADRHVVQVHTRLVEIALEQGDAYTERLHRGIGLIRLAGQVVREPDGHDNPAAQRMLFQAIDQLKKAAHEKPDEPRPQWYLHVAWSNLGQSQPAREALVRARKFALLGGLTPAETERLNLTE